MVHTHPDQVAGGLTAVVAGIILGTTDVPFIPNTAPFLVGEIVLCGLVAVLAATAYHYGAHR